MRSNSYNIADLMTSTLQGKYSDFDFYHAQRFHKRVSRIMSMGDTPPQADTP